ncbi:hypothetical protein BUALT_Bualt08G0096100 [Buddleja alternifolia]|uniref:RING-type E3 ubiquitin transferase n=1 Tax=Buddleja alternifolia TaxID=168488 RepID=A0AAV6X689_9LAMI|nr:hypothetical protein BUALT_Bualt08G0096100 [Buddleja alternifolia]
MVNFTNCQKSTYIYHEDVFSSEEYPEYSSANYHIHFNFLCKPFFRQWVLHQDSADPQYERLVTLPEIENFIIMNRKDFISQETARKTIKETLKHWPVDENWSKKFIDYVMIKAKNEIITMPGCHNSVFLEFQILNIHKHVYDEGRALESAIIQESNNNSSYMVGSSIELLEMNKIMHYGTTCSICLEEFRGNGACEGVIMPCKHIFHGDCIKKWLTISHYCPVCRFEMPTS